WRLRRVPPSAGGRRATARRPAARTVFSVGLSAGVGPPAGLKPGVKTALADRDFVAVEALLDRTPLRSAEHELLLRFPALRGGADILDAAGGLVRNRRSERALGELARVPELLRAHRFGGAVSFHLCAIPGFRYSTGAIFQGS